MYIVITGGAGLACGYARIAAARRAVAGGAAPRPPHPADLVDRVAAAGADAVTRVCAW